MNDWHFHISVFYLVLWKCGLTTLPSTMIFDLVIEAVAATWDWIYWARQGDGGKRLQYDGNE